MDGSVEVYWARNAGDAHLVAGMLESEGIRAEVINEMLQGAAGELALGPSSAPRVIVAEADAARAQAIVGEWEQRPREPSETWRCEECGEQVAVALDACDYCYTPRGAAKPKPERVPDLRLGHAVAIFLVWFVAPLFVGYALFMVGLPEGAVYALSSLAGAVLMFKLTQAVLGGALGERGRAMIGLTDVPTRLILLGAAIGLFFAGAYFVAAFTILPPDETAPDRLDELATGSATGFVLWMLLAVGIAPFFEEFLFRGVLLHALRERWGVVAGVLLSTVLFAAVHLGPDTYWPFIPFVAAGGLVDALLRLKTNSLYPAVASHLSHNLAMGVWLFAEASPGW